MTEWRTDLDAAREAKGPLLVFTDKGHIHYVTWDDDWNAFWCFETEDALDGGINGRPTHWMPLPPRPAP